ncbi:hypothetical protein Tco_0705885 [Tanacetum coccineum]|uniref:Uncharacterized protein n=1 Tax=Tanacetum coccineum TaxID=301880 RepID=A0ABQ4Y5U6_9ASTR
MVNNIETPKSKEPEKALEDEFMDLHLNLLILEVLAHAPMYNAILDKYESEDMIDKKIDWKKPPKEGYGAWHIRIELIDLDEEMFDRVFQSIPTTRKLSEKEKPSNILDLKHFYDA